MFPPGQPFGFLASASWGIAVAPRGGMAAGKLGRAALVLVVVVVEEEVVAHPGVSGHNPLA